MKLFTDGQDEMINIRVSELEKELAKQDYFRKLSDEQYGAIKNLKNLLGDVNWLVLDEFVCAKNQECELLMNYFYISGLKDGKKLVN